MLDDMWNDANRYCSGMYGKGCGWGTEVTSRFFECLMACGTMPTDMALVCLCGRKILALVWMFEKDI